MKMNKLKKLIKRGKGEASSNKKEDLMKITRRKEEEQLNNLQDNI